MLHRKPWPILQAVQAGELRAFQPGGEGAWLVRSDDLTAWVAASVNAPRETSGGTLSERLARARA